VIIAQYAMLAFCKAPYLNSCLCLFPPLLCSLLCQALRFSGAAEGGESASDDGEDGIGPAPSAARPREQYPQDALMPLGVWAEGGVAEAVPVAEHSAPAVGPAAIVREEWMVDPGQNKVQGEHIRGDIPPVFLWHNHILVRVGSNVCCWW
jgi:hypothetical protein